MPDNRLIEDLAVSFTRLSCAVEAYREIKDTLQDLRARREALLIEGSKKGLYLTESEMVAGLSDQALIDLAMELREIGAKLVEIDKQIAAQVNREFHIEAERQTALRFFKQAHYDFQRVATELEHGPV